MENSNNHNLIIIAQEAAIEEKERAERRKAELIPLRQRIHYEDKAAKMISAETKKTVNSLLKKVANHYLKIYIQK